MSYRIAYVLICHYVLLKDIIQTLPFVPKDPLQQRSPSLLCYITQLCLYRDF